MSNEFIEKGLLDGLASQIPGAIYQFRMHDDGTFCMPYASERLREIFGVFPDEVKDDASVLFSVVHPDDVAMLEQSILESAKNLKQWDYEFRVVSEPGVAKWIQGSSKPTRQDDGSTLWMGYVVDVTEKKNAEKEVKEAREKFAFYFEKAPEGFFVINQERKYIDVNPAACLMTGYSKDEILQMDILDIVADSFKEQADVLFNESFSKGQSINEIPLKRKSGEIIWVSLISSRLSNDELIGFCYDITDRVEAKRALEMQLGFQSMLATISSNFVNATVSSLNQAIDYALEHCAEFFNADRSYVFQFSDDYVLMSNTHEWCAPGIIPQKEFLQDYRVEQMIWWSKQIIEKRVIHIPDVKGNAELSDFEKEVLLQQSIQSLLSIPMINNGILIGFMGLDRVNMKKGWDVHDISQFKVLGEILSGALAKHKAELKLRKSESRYRLLAENARDMIYRIRLKPDRAFEYVSPSSTLLTGFTPEEHYGDNMLGFNIVHPHDRHILVEMSEGTAIFDKPLVLRWIRKDGSLLWCEQRNVPIYGKNGELVAIEGIARDITEQKNIEERLKVVNAELWDKKLALESFNRSLEQRINLEVERNRNLDQMMALQARQAALGEMMGNIAHQWRQPLNVVSLAIYDLAEAFDHKEFSKEYMEETMNEINRIVQRMSKTIDDFRSYFSPQKEKKTINVKSIVQSALLIMSADLESNDINVDSEFDDNAIAFGYSNELIQIIINILKNALDSILEYKPRERSIKVIVSAKEDKCSIRIFNSGPQVSEKNLLKLFDPYFTTKDENNALGLGLYIAKTLVEKNMKGKIYCNNQDNGVQFTIELPAY